MIRVNAAIFSPAVSRFRNLPARYQCGGMCQKDTARSDTVNDPELASATTATESLATICPSPTRTIDADLVPERSATCRRSEE